MKKAVLKLDLHDDKAKKKAMKKVSSLLGVDSISMDMKDKKLTVIGEVDPVGIVSKLRKLCRAEILTVGPAKEPEKKKDEPKKEDQKKKDQDLLAEWLKAHQAYNLHMTSPYQANNSHMTSLYQAYNPHMTSPYYGRGVEEDPNACVIS